MPDSDVIARAALDVLRDELDEALKRAADRLGVVKQLSPNARRRRRWRERQRALRRMTQAASNGEAAP